MGDHRLLMPTFVALADTLVDDFDLMDLLALLADRAVEIFGLSAAGIMLAGPGGRLRVVASSSEAMRLLEVLEIQAREGPCLDCYRTRRAVEMQSLETARQWPTFAPEAMRLGFSSVLALPMRLRGEVIGALNVFNDHTDGVHSDDLAALQALADVATIAILQYRSAISAQVLNEQLTEALQSRIAIEQAKGVLAERQSTTVDAAFTAMRTFSRNRGLHLIDVAQGVIDGTVEVPLEP